MHALKGQQLLSQGNALGLHLVSFIRPVRAKALIDLRKGLELLPFQGEYYRLYRNPRRCLGLGAYAPSGRSVLIRGLLFRLYLRGTLIWDY